MKGNYANVRIKSAEIHSAGPIRSFKEEFAPLTVIYARNERGKTTIVENLVACLFRRRKGGMQLRRDFIGGARVAVTGIAEKSAVFSSAGDGRKVDDLIEDLGWPYPTGLFDLLVVRGAELEVLGQREGLTRTTLRSLISQERLYETLKSRLPGEIGYTKLEGGILLPRKRIGAYKSWEETQSRLASLETAAELFYRSLSRTELMSTLSRQAELQREQKQLQLAKRHTAYLLHHSAGQLRAQLERFDEQQAERFGDTVKDVIRTRSELAGLEKETHRRDEAARDLQWLEEVRRRYDQIAGSRRNPLQSVSFLLAGAGLLGALAAYFLVPGLLPAFLIATSVFFTLALLLTFAWRGGSNPESARAELREIRKAFRERFGAPLSTRADFDLFKSRLDQELGKAQGLEERILAVQAAHQGQLQQCREYLREAERPEVPDSQWGALSEELKRSTRQLRIDYNLARQRLEDIGIDEVDYLEEEVEESYSRRREAEIAGELEAAEAKIQEQRDSSRELREQLIEHIGREAARSQSVEEVAEAIEEKKEEYRRQAQDHLARMIAGHVVAEVLEDIRSVEDRQLKSTLNDSQVTGLVEKFTGGRYKRVALDETGLLIENDTESYALEQLSSGAREQVLLALRMGLASVVCGTRSLFLILDDAFQYSDWRRREQLVLQAVQIVKSGWQVIYLTMDDDIRDRFRRAAETLGEGLFRLIEL